MADPLAPYETALEVVQRLVHDADAPEAVRADPRGWFERAGLDEADARAMAATPTERLFVYRSLVRRGLTDAIRKQIPKTAARLGDAYERSVMRWLDEELPRSPYLRDVAFEFVAWAAPRWEPEGAPAYLADLANHELSAFVVACAPNDVAAGTEVPFHLDATLTFDPSVHLFRYAFAVHRLADDEAAREEPEREATRLVGYRDAELDVEYLEVTPLAAALLDRLLAGATVRAAIDDACAALGMPVDEHAFASTAELLADLAERGALRAARAPTRAAPAKR